MKDCRQSHIEVQQGGKKKNLARSVLMRQGLCAVYLPNIRINESQNKHEQQDQL